MAGEYFHPRDEILLLYAGGELPDQNQMEEMASHISGCPDCEARLSELKAALADFTRAQRQACDSELPSAEKARAALISRMAEGNAAGNYFFTWSPGSLAWRAYAFAVVILIAVSLLALYRRELNASPRLSASISVRIEPSLDLTPGATLPVTRAQICSATAKPHDFVVPVSLQREVFALYGMENASTNYEVDYLITPELGGATDVRNLWPQPYFDTAWNAHVKDQLEDRLHEMVCRGEVDLATAQQDISRDWIAAYRKYFHTDIPLADTSLHRL
jgi:hypothetical protein